MAIVKFYNALGRGANMGNTDVWYVPNTGTLVVDGPPLVTPWDFDTDALTFSYNGERLWATAFVSEIGHPFYLIESLYYADARLRPLVDLYAINIQFNANDDFSSGVVFTNLLSSSDTIEGNMFADVLKAGDGNDLVRGLGGNDRIEGERGSDKLIGGSGADRLIGGAGADLLIGGTGADVFQLSRPTDSGALGEDVVSDFTRGQDKIDLSSLDANTATAANDAFRGFIGASQTFNAPGQLKLVNGVLYGNTDRDGAAEFGIELTGIRSLSTADVIL